MKKQILICCAIFLALLLFGLAINCITDRLENGSYIFNLALPDEAEVTTTLLGITISMTFIGVGLWVGTKIDYK